MKILLVLATLAALLWTANAFTRQYRDPGECSVLVVVDVVLLVVNWFVFG